MSSTLTVVIGVGVDGCCTVLEQLAETDFTVEIVVIAKDPRNKVIVWAPQNICSSY